MKNLHNYYVIDSLSETVIGSFSAVSDEAARVIFDNAVKSNDKIAIVKDYAVLFCDDVHPVTVLECTSEIMDSRQLLPVV